ncbi:sigma-70 family RNA polymerase sigma factor [Luteolibacter sp. GHJ8]|uniref:Sigma-70 family RNA polymerase sigma factor n=1 Tax=Luteolibacter rhizosphaerae TaxID=2989719 RepID=A0ABT3G636_9BACT|nr:sigma-70 family RNA polymerase sigma factor [Luteolibacter rhizosphaerae]MCW1915298.1 sigma-70 family RNA polymerase sigma factor [Luteolibacter rhizosphaerae]
MSGTGPSDSELLADWLDGHRESAFHALVERYAGLVHMAAKRTCGDDSLAAEASQLAFIALARKARGLSGRATLAGWLHVTAILQARNLLRQRKREIRKLHILRTHMENQPQASPAAEWQRIQPVLDEALAALSSKDRETLLLRFYRSLSVREIGAALGIATDAAQKRLDRATEKLRGQLARRGYQVGGSLGAVMLAGFASDAQAAVPSTSLLASNALAVAGGSGTATLTTIGIIAMTKKTAITAGVVVLLAGAGTIALINGNKDENSSSAKGHTEVNTAPSSSASSFTPVESAAARGDRAKPRDPAANPDFIAKYGEARTNLSKHIATNLISLLEDAVSMGEMAVSGQMGNAFGGPRNGLRMGLGGRLNDDLKLTDEQQEKAGEIYKEYQKRELAKSKESIEKLKKDPQALMQLMLASDAHSRGEIPQDEYDQIQASIADDLKTTINPLDRENFRGGQPMKDTAFTSEFQAILDPDQSATFAAAATEQQSKAAEDRSINNLPSMELEKMDQTVTSAKKLTTGLKSMMEGMGGLQDLGPMMEERRRSREAQRGAQQEAAPESTTPPAGE